MLLSYGARLDVKIDDKFAIDIVCGKNAWKQMEIILPHLLDNPPSIDTDFGSAFLDLCDANQWAMADHLLNLNLNLNLCCYFKKGDIKGLTALHCAIRAKQHEFCQRLILKGAKLTESYKDGPTALAFAITDGKLETFKFVFNQAQLSPENKVELLDIAITKNKHLAIKFLLDQGAADKFVATAIKKSDYDAIEKVINYFTGQNIPFETLPIDVSHLLLKAIQAKQFSLANTLLNSYPADSIDLNQHVTWQPTHRNNYFSKSHPGMTALHFAVLAKQQDLIKRLIQMGANPQFSYCEGLTAVELAKEHASNMVEIIKQAVLNTAEETDYQVGTNDSGTLLMCSPLPL